MEVTEPLFSTACLHLVSIPGISSSYPKPFSVPASEKPHPKQTQFHPKATGPTSKSSISGLIIPTACVRLAFLPAASCHGHSWRLLSAIAGATAAGAAQRAAAAAAAAAAAPSSTVLLFHHRLGILHPSLPLRPTGAPPDPPHQANRSHSYQRCHPLPD